MSDYEEGYEAAMEATNSFNWEPPLFNRLRAATMAFTEDIYCWHCHKALNADEWWYCFDCEQECWAGWGS
jgi:hypothetical protein